jgi:uncharacterized protein YndB with AHSA1/START domain
MNHVATLDAYGVVTEPATLTIERLLPGPIDRVWAYLTQSELRRQWFAAGDMELKLGATVELHWRNDELTNPPGERPPGSSSEHTLECRITELDPPRRLAITWGRSGGVSFALDSVGEEVRLTLVHRRLPDRETMLKVGAGWHAHLDLLVARITGAAPAPFWDTWTRLKHEYDARIPA